MLTDLSQIKTGPQLQKLLHSEGLTRCRVVKDRPTEQFIVRFYERIIAGYVEPAEAWIPQLESIIPDAAIVAHQNIRATWQPGEPVITATIWLEIPQTTEKDLLILGCIILANRLIGLIEQFIKSFTWASLIVRRILFRQWWTRLISTPMLPAPQIYGYLPAPQSATPIADAIETYGTAPVKAALLYMAAKAGQEAEAEYWERRKASNFNPNLTLAELHTIYPALPTNRDYNA